MSKHEQLPERSLDVLFGKGDEVRRALIRAWLDEGRDAMGPTPTTVRDALHKRLEWNQPVLDKLPEVRMTFLMYTALTPLSGLCTFGDTYRFGTLYQSQGCD